MTTKTEKTQTPFDFEASLKDWEQMSQKTTEQLIEATQKSFDQTLALYERMAGMWLTNVKKLQEITLKESEAALEAAEAFQTQVQAAAERTSKMMPKG